MTDVTEPIVDVTATTVEPETTTPTPTGENKTGDETVTPPANGEKPTIPESPESTAMQKQIDNLNKALALERKKNKRSTTRTVDTGGQFADDDEVLSHPGVQDLLLKNATYELREGVKDILENYPQVPKPLVKAILGNPRGWVNDGTRDVQSALLDIEENLVRYLDEEPTAPAGPVPKVPKVMNNNSLQNNQAEIDTQVQRILGIPPEEWTTDDDKIMAEYTKSR